MLEIANSDEMRLVYLSLSIIALTIIAIALLAYGVNGIPFYAVAIIAIALGFYMARSIAAQSPEETARARRKAR